MLQQIIAFRIFSKPSIFYIGILTLSSFLFTAVIAVLNRKGINKIPFEWHPRMAIISIVLAIFHAALGILAYF